MREPCPAAKMTPWYIGVFMGGNVSPSISIILSGVHAIARVHCVRGGCCGASLGASNGVAAANGAHRRVIARRGIYVLDFRAQ